MTLPRIFAPSIHSPSSQPLSGTPCVPRGHSMAALHTSAMRTFAVCSFAAAALLASNSATHAQAATSASPPAAASGPAPGSALRLPSNREVNAAFDRADENHDARLTRTEADRFPEVARRFEQIDSNRDTFISREEFTKAVLGTS